MYFILPIFDFLEDQPADDLEDGAVEDARAVDVPAVTNFSVSVLPVDGFVGFMPIVESKTKTKYDPVVPVKVSDT